MIMLRREIAAVLALTALLLSFAGYAADVVRFKEEAFVKGPKLTLGEIADIEGANSQRLAALEIGMAPAPGESKRIEQVIVAARIKTAGKAPDIQIAGANSIKTTTLHQEVSRDAVAESLRQYIQSEMPWTGDDTAIEVSPPPQDFVLPEGLLEFQWHAAGPYRYLGAGSFRGSLMVDGELKKTFVCRAEVEAYGDVIIASSAIPRGKPISINDISTERRPLSTLKDTGFTDPAEMLGTMAAKPIAAGQVIARDSLKPVTVIKKNQLVTVETRAGGLAVVTQAQAAADAAVGESVQCINPGSKEAFVGIVRADGTVVVK